MNEKRTITETTKIFSERLNELVQQAKNGGGKTLAEGRIADNIGINRPALHKYLDNNAEIGINSLVKIAKYFGVSTDYLLGLTNATPSALIVREVCEATGLTEDALRGILSLTEEIAPGYSVPAPAQYDAITRKTIAPACSKPLIERYDAIMADEAEFTLPRINEGEPYEAVFQYARPSRRTVINEMLSYEEFADFIDALREGVSVQVASLLHEEFCKIKSYIGYEKDKYYDPRAIGAAKYEVQAKATEILGNLFDAYLAKYQAVIDKKLHEYSLLVQECSSRKAGETGSDLNG